MIGHGFLLCFVLFTLASAHSKPNSQPLPIPLILEYPSNEEIEEKQEVDFRCTSWRVAVEAGNLNPWKTIPLECAEYERDYITGRVYSWDLELVAEEAGVYARSVELSGDGKDVWIFDVDETLLSNLPYYAERGFGLELFDKHELDHRAGKFPLFFHYVRRRSEEEEDCPISCFLTSKPGFIKAGRSLFSEPSSQPTKEAPVLLSQLRPNQLDSGPLIFLPR